MKYADLIWNEERECWICSGCGAEYPYPKKFKTKT